MKATGADAEPDVDAPTAAGAPPPATDTGDAAAHAATSERTDPQPDTDQPAGPEPDTGGGPGGRAAHRLRDLDRRGRIWAAVFAAALLLAPALAFAWAAPDWLPANDPALMALRALDVGTARTPLTGQPSTSAHYVGAEQHVDHPGALHFYLMAGPVRVLGSAIGMLVVSVAITGGSVLLAAWAFFRQLGRTAGALAAVALGAVTFTTGAAALVNPVSSNIAGYPLLCSMVLLWCLVCGDLRLLPLAAAVVSFTAQQHLSVLPALSAGTALAVAAGAVAWGRGGRWRGRAARRELLRWSGLAAAVALVMWAPVLVEQLDPDGGNLTRMAEFARDSDRPTVGVRSAVYQVVNVLGLPPMLGQTQLAGDWLLERPSPVTWVSAGVVVALLGLLAFRWRQSEPRRLALVVMAGVLALAGLANGSAVPESLEKYRLPLYHWAFPLALFVVVALGLGATDAVRRVAALRGGVRPAVRPALAVGAVLAIAVPAAVNPSLDRRSNTLLAAYAPVERDLVDRAADQVMDHRDALGGEVVMLGRGVAFDGVPDALAVMLTERGVDVRFTPQYRHYVHDQRLVDWGTVDAGVMVVVDDGLADVAPVGELVADVPVVPGFDAEAFDQLTAQASAGGAVRFGPDVERGLDALPADIVADIEARGSALSMEELVRLLPPEDIPTLRLALVLSTLTEDPAPRLLDREVLGFLVEHPLAEPRLDPDLVRRLYDSLPDDWSGGPLRLLVYRLDRGELDQAVAPDERT